MSILFVGSTGDGAGHTLLTWAIAVRLQERGLRVGVVKPFGTHPVRVDGNWTDLDALLFKEALKLQEPLPQICPYPLSEDAWKETGASEILGGLKGALQGLSAEKDVILIMGSRHIFFDDAAFPVPDASFISELGADFVLVHRYRKASKSIYSILSVCSLLRESMVGVIFNRVPQAEFQMVSERVLPSLLQKGVPAVAALPEEPALSFRSLREIKEVIGGEVLSGEEKLERPVASMTVGSADLEGGLLIFRRAYNKIVLLSQTPESEAESPGTTRPIAGVLLTGARLPAPQLVQAARKAEIPLLLVKEDTFAALEKLEQSPSILSARDVVKVRRFMELLDRNGSLEGLLDRLRL